MSKSTSKTLLIDGDLILYRSTAAVEKEVRFDEENHVLFGNETESWTAVEYELAKLFERFDTRQHVIALTEGPVFRLAIEPNYKANRTGVRKPMAYTAVRERLEQNYNVVKLKGLEADDVLGIFATRDPESTIVCSEDKDLQTIPCTLFRGGEVRKIDAAQADYFHLYQTLTGDTSDGYPGCPGIGPKKAEALLAAAVGESRVPWLDVIKAFEKAGLTEADALKQARLARILRDEDWDAENKTPILWAPPNG